MRYELILYAAMLLLAVFFLVRFLDHLGQPDPILVPRQIAVSDMDDHTPQEVYNWVAYVTRLTGRGYLEQLAFERGMRHYTLLHDLLTGLNTDTEEDLLDRLREVAYRHRLSAEILDKPI